MRLGIIIFLLATTKVLRAANAFSTPCWGSFHFPVQGGKCCRQWSDCNVGKATDGDGWNSLNAQCVFVCLWKGEVRANPSSGYPYPLFQHACTHTRQSVISHDLRRVISRDDLVAVSAQNWVLQAPLSRARGCRLAAAQGVQRRCWSAWLSWGQRIFHLNRKK